MNKLFIHIGTPKTGSTSIQHFCYTNEEFLRKNGWVYPSFDGYFTSQFKEINGAVFCYPDAFHAMDPNRHQWEELWGLTLELLETNNVILSNETFWFAGNLPFIREAAARWENLEILVYLRRQDLYLESMYLNNIRSGEIRDFNEYLDECINYGKVSMHGNDWILDYDEQLKLLSDIVGVNRIHVRPFEKKKFKNENLIVDFLEVLGIYDNGIANVITDIHENQALPMEKLELYRLFNRAMSEGERIAYGYFKNSGMAKLDALFFPDSKSGTKCTLLRPKERESIWDCFRSGNEKIEQMYCKGQSLFSYKRPEGEPWKPELTAMESARLSVQFKMYIFSWAEAHKSSTLTSIQLHLKGRKLVLYGLGGCGRNIIDRYPMPIDVIVDNVLCKETASYRGIPVVGIGEISDWEGSFFIIGIRDFREVEEQIKSHNLLKDRDYIIGAEHLKLVNWNMLG